jgi:putative acid phosphatase of HAD superfamily subfamily IIIB
MTRKRVSRLLTVILALPILAALSDARSGIVAGPENAKPPGPSHVSRASQRSERPRVAPLRNLTLVKEELIAYHDCHCDCGCYEQDLERTGGAALAFLRRYVEAHPRTLSAPDPQLKPALVLDVDETALSNWENIRRTDFAFSRVEYLGWEREMRATPIRPTLELFQFAKGQGLATIFITGRTESEREWTTKDLESAGYQGWTLLVMRQADSPKPAGEFKSAERKKLRAQGYLIVENVGDQASDLAGDPALRSFKLPNPFYLVR